MTENNDYKRFAILYVDDEEKSLKTFAGAFGDEFRILTATNAQDGLRLLEAHRDEIAILMTDQRMPGEKGTWLLERARTVAPATLRLLVTAYSEFKDAVTAINDGGIYHYVHKPWNPTELETLLRRAMEFFLLQRENTRLAREKLEALRNVLVADRLVSLGMLTAGLSHHLRNALVSVKSFLDLAPAMMQDEKAAPHELRHEEFWGDYHRRVLQQIDKINDLLKELWATSEQPATQTTERLNLHTVVADCAQTLQETLASRQIRIANEIPADLPSVIAERDKFQRLFRLLLKEELASLPPGSVITYTATTITEGDRSMVRVQIRDNGPGLPAEKLQCLFDPFMVRADTPSEYGIHLMGCFFIVHQHGGRIEAASEPGQGTTFTLSLPTQPAKAVDDINQGIPQKSRLAAQVWGGVRA
jgi:signal transduction histidine kinase